MDLQAIRREYLKGGLSRSDLPEDPVTLFNLWLQQAIEMQLADPTAMVLATSCKDQPSQRIVLLKGFDERGFVFFTNYESRKARAISVSRSTGTSTDERSWVVASHAGATPSSASACAKRK